MRFILLMVFLGGLVSCKKKTAGPMPELPSVPVRVPAIRSEMQAWPSPFWTAKGKIYLNMGGNSIPVNLSLRAEEGKAIWFSATAFGLLEVARGRVDQDSVRILDKVNNRCYRSGLNGLGAYLPVSMGIRHLQHFLMGRIFWDSLEAGKRNTAGDTLRLNGQQAGVDFSADLFQKFSLLKAKASIQAAEVNLENRDFRMVSGYPVAFYRDLRSRYEQGGQVSEAGLKMEYSRFDFVSAPPDMEFSLPPDCRPMELK